ncbi:MAG: NADH-ubiquinone oxidoreductase-F iron-sulfur binding region domain-containing protein [Patescibacteria group bacterium]|nr:NADH-ubiquinone oxidoreductase-F iron-sulfur binding region domain-containing protein [Patescibacteria group bacterium]MDD5295093.1 NADH-ubiquinone oxidoreductase-F iron-sulfur binding region domain-containing protein [Patescibacteria group bacterium]MDD5554162.1 NADH-ubiquinone oxidoreductase-F iron-sulfur binding region domain-containing protein [Patescibacteria group bacterium]
MDILVKIKKAGLVGRGGASFPVADKWKAVKKAKGAKKYVVCNASEGEPGVAKDSYILENFPEKVIGGIKIAIDFLKAKKAYIYINHNYHKKFSKNLIKIIDKAPIEFFIKPIESGYIGGEESSMLNAIEGKRIEPRLRPPFPQTSGLWGCPTLINNVETFYNVSLVALNQYKKERFYTISGDCLWTGVFLFPDNWTIEKILKETKNYPRFPFFVQVGGEASGEVLGSRQLRQPVSGAGSITVYSMMKHKPENLIKSWLDFFLNESCGKCTPCREGVYRLREMMDLPNPDWQLFSELLTNLEEIAFCGLGIVVPVPIKSYLNNVLVKMPASKINLRKLDKKTICECFR